VTRPAHDGVPAVTMTDLLRHTLRHRPDRIILGEVRGAEAWDLLQALNTGHPGSLTTIHANTAAAALDRLAMLVLTAHHGVPYEVVNQTIAHAIAGIVQLTRRRDDPDRADSPRRRVVADLCVIDQYSRANDTWRLTPIGDPTPARERSTPC
jgi:Flp pilus assembly CpaF family ATPase